MRKSPPGLVKVVLSPVSGVYATYSNSGRRFRRHWHDCFSVGLIDAGAQRWTSRAGRVEAMAGAVINSNPGEVHDGEPLGSASRAWRMLSLEPAVMRLLAGTMPAAVIAPPVITDPALRGLLELAFDSLDHWASSGHTIDALRFEETLVAACTLLMSKHGSSPGTVRMPRTDMSVLRARLVDPAMPAPSLAELSRIAGMSRYQTLRAFARQYGAPPGAWLMSHRAEQARALIRRGASLGTAAAQGGFSDQAHMTRVFTQLFGYTPGAWQRASRWPGRRGSPEGTRDRQCQSRAHLGSED